MNSKIEERLHPEFFHYVSRNYKREAENKAAGIQKISQKKKRKCNKCRDEFISEHFGNAFCGSCAAQNQRASVRASKIL